MQPLITKDLLILLGYRDGALLLWEMLHYGYIGNIEWSQWDWWLTFNVK